MTALRSNKNVICQYIVLPKHMDLNINKIWILDPDSLEESCFTSLSLRFLICKVRKNNTATYLCMVIVKVK